jgi:glycolate oxidase FAD binding subunit
MTSSDFIRQIESIVGTDCVERSPDIVIDGLSPLMIARPGSREEVAECLKVCSEANLAVVPSGLGGWLECGNPLRRADCILSLERMSRIIDYSPADLTVMVEAGLTVKELYDATRQERQWLPLDPPGSARASLGAVASCASSGALRLGFGTPRDYVIGLRLAHADGSESKSGGRVVKNVAGYDMNKLYIGSFGTLAVITELTLKLRPLADSSSSMTVRSESLTAVGETARRVLAADLLPVSVVLAKGVSREVTGTGFDGWELAVRFIENETAVEHQISRVIEIIGSNASYSIHDGEKERAMWERLVGIDRAGAVLVKISLPLSKSLEALGRLPESLPGCAVVGDAGTGIIRIAFDAGDEKAIEMIERLRAEAGAMGGTLIVERAATSVRRRADAWGEPGQTASIMRAIKERLDPQSLLNPGRFVCGI